MSALPHPHAAPWQRPMLAADLDRVLAIELAAYSHPWSRGNFIDSLAAGYDAGLRLEPAGELIGYWVAMSGLDETHLLNLTVAPAWQRRGHGRAMLDRLCSACRARGERKLWLEVRESNITAQALYRGFGFADSGRRRGYYPAEGRREDALVMSLALDGGGHGDALV